LRNDVETAKVPTSPYNNFILHKSFESLAEFIKKKHIEFVTCALLLCS